MINWWDMNDIQPHKNLTLGRKDGVGKPLFDYENKYCKIYFKLHLLTQQIPDQRRDLALLIQSKSCNISIRFTSTA